MKTILPKGFFTQNGYANSFMLFSLLTHILAAITSTGFHHADEHFQLLEPLGWKLGFYGPNDLAWEFTDKIRPGLQIILGWIVGKTMIAADAYSPFMLTAILRQLTGLLWWILTWAFYNKWKQEHKDTVMQKALLLFSACLWFLPYLHVRYSSESWGGLLFFAALYVVLCPPKTLKVNLSWLLGGLLMGLSFYFRFQMAFAIVGFVAWAFRYKKFTPASFSLLVSGGIIAAAIGTLTDYWLYNQWVCTPYNYFFQNIVADKASSFGTSPFYSYITMFIEIAAPPLSLLLLVLMCFGLWTSRRSPYTWVLVAFVVAHSAVAHKEFRFMFPMVALMPYLCVQGFLAIKSRLSNISPSVIKYSVKGFVAFNLALMAISLIKPASEREALFKAFYIVHNTHKNTKIVFAEKDPFDCGLKMNFFRYCNSCFVKQNEMNTAVDGTFFLYTDKIGGVVLQKNSIASLEYCVAPIVPQPMNIGHWQERTNKGFLWKIMPKQDAQ
ncbi:hypothetical protein QQ054_07795 [Oscillatoria amoena NRMC-F 0135]|nr:hypothetical protein [Oscillatoria amoena NRMC-F 0135]